MKRTSFIILLSLTFGIAYSCKAPKGNCDAYSYKNNSSKDFKDPIKKIESENSSIGRN